MPDADIITVLEATFEVVGQFFVQADISRDRRADAAGPSLLRRLHDIWHMVGKDALRDLDAACERLLFPVPEGLPRGAGKGSRGGGRDGGGRGRPRGPHGGGGGGGGYGPPSDGYATYVPYGQGRYEAGPPAHGWGPGPSAPRPPRDANHEDRCVHCQGEHLSQRCFTKFPNLRPPR